MPSAALAARSILTSLHEVMASRERAQAKLNRVVDTIAESMDSEVCSIYLLREGMLELFATHGLSQSAVHVTRMSVGEGLVGTIAQNIETLNLAEAANHPEFAYRPETGEELFHSFAGVPIVRRERAIGVLAVQHAEARAYDALEIEALQTVAMVLSELIANAGLADKAAKAGADRQLGDVDSALVEAAGGEQLEQPVAQQVDRADLAIEGLADDLDDLVELALRMRARGHHVMQLVEDRTGSGNGGHGVRLSHKHAFGNAAGRFGRCACCAVLDEFQGRADQAINEAAALP